MKNTFCAWCIATLPYPATWKDEDTEDGAELQVRTWRDAVEAYGNGYRYTTPEWLTYGIHAVTFVSGTAACYGHGYFLARDLLA